MTRSWQSIQKQPSNKQKWFYYVNMYCINDIVFYNMKCSYDLRMVICSLVISFFEIAFHDVYLQECCSYDNNELHQSVQFELRIGSYWYCQRDFFSFLLCMEHVTDTSQFIIYFLCSSFKSLYKVISQIYLLLFWDIIIDVDPFFVVVQALDANWCVDWLCSCN